MNDKNALIKISQEIKEKNILTLLYQISYRNVQINNNKIKSLDQANQSSQPDKEVVEIIATKIESY